MPTPKNFYEKLDVQLIRLVKASPVLYDNSFGKYIDFNAREVAWQKIGDELRRPAADCKVRWINIRDVSRRLYRKSLLDPGSTHRPYKYANELKFMRPFYRDVNVNPTQNYYSDDETNNDNNDVAEPPQFLEEPRDDTESDEQEKPRTRKKRKATKKHKKFYEDIKPDMPTATEQTELDPADPVDAFLLSIGATLKTFSPYHLNVAKSKIFNIVQEHDLQQIVQKQQRGDSQSCDIKVPTGDPMFMQ